MASSGTSEYSRPRWGGQLVLGNGVITYIGPGATADTHSHHAVQLVWSFGRPVTVRVDEQALSVGAAIVGANVSHSFEATNDQIALLLIEPHGPRGRAVDAVAQDLSSKDLQKRLALIGPPPRTGATATAAWASGVVDCLVEAPIITEPTHEMRPEVRQAIGYVERSIDGVPRLTEAAAQCGISATRLTHLFTAQVGMPFRRFVLWTRIKRATEEVALGHDLTRAAAMAGFSDSAHFSRVFRSNFGLSPSEVLPRMDIVGRLGPSLRTASEL